MLRLRAVSVVALSPCFIDDGLRFRLPRNDPVCCAVMITRLQSIAAPQLRQRAGCVSRGAVDGGAFSRIAAQLLKWVCVHSCVAADGVLPRLSHRLDPAWCYQCVLLFPFALCGGGCDTTACVCVCMIDGRNRSGTGAAGCHGHRCRHDVR